MWSRKPGAWRIPRQGNPEMWKIGNLKKSGKFTISHPLILIMGLTTDF